MRTTKVLNRRVRPVLSKMPNMSLYFATGNAGKAVEFAKILQPVEVKQVTLELEELQDPKLEVISARKAMQAAGILGEPAVVDDSGLFVKALGGFPGPYSAYTEDTIGLQGIIDLLVHYKDRSAKFISVVSYAEPGNEPHIFRGEVDGTITTSPRGENGFGFDPIFEYRGRTFAEFDMQEKNSVSHRSRALQDFKDWYFANKVYCD